MATEAERADLLPYWDTFCRLLTMDAQKRLKYTGFDGNPDTMLVAFPTSGSSEPMVFTVSEHPQYVSADVQGVAERAKVLYEQHPRQGMYVTAKHMRGELDDQLRSQTRARALEEALNRHCESEGRIFFAGLGTRVGNFHVHAVLSVDAAPLERVPRLRSQPLDDAIAVPSIIHGIIYSLLEFAQHELHIPKAGHLGVGRLERGAPEVWQQAINQMLRTVLARAGHRFNSIPDEYLQGFASLMYEGRPSAGRLVIAPHDDPVVEVDVRWISKVRLDKPRDIRKLLEASGGEAALLIDDRSAYGLGRVHYDKYDASAETVFEISVTGPGQWQLSHADDVLFRVQADLPKLPQPPVDLVRLREVLSRILSDADLEALEALATAASGHHHGAMLIISGDAACEAQRLAPQATRTQPTRLSSELLTHLTNMDGGILLDPQGRCHALGVILDGTAQGNGDPARGSRYNNAERYLASGHPEAVVLCYSSDGGVEIMSV